MKKTETIIRTIRTIIPTVISAALSIFTFAKTFIFYGAGKFPHPLNTKVLGIIINNFIGGEFISWVEPYITVGILIILSLISWIITAVIIFSRNNCRTSA